MMVQTIMITSDKFKLVGICPNGNSSQKWIVKLKHLKESRH